jgi:hypothetical protein
MEQQLLVLKVQLKLVLATLILELVHLQIQLANFQNLALLDKRLSRVFPRLHHHY